MLKWQRRCRPWKIYFTCDVDAYIQPPVFSEQKNIIRMKCRKKRRKNNTSHRKVPTTLAEWENKWQAQANGKEMLKSRYLWRWIQQMNGGFGALLSLPHDVVISSAFEGDGIVHTNVRTQELKGAKNYGTNWQTPVATVNVVELCAIAFESFVSSRQEEA